MSTQPQTEQPRLCILMNPGSGKQGGRSGMDDHVRAFAEERPHVTLREPAEGESLGDVAREVVAGGYDIVVAAGGDGTIGAVASALLQAGGETRLGILPMGTFNFFARSLGIPMDIDEALQVLVTGEAMPMSIGEVNGVPFLNNASLGIYPAILERREKVYRRWGRSRLAAYWSVLLTLAGFRRARTLRVSVDGVERRRRTPLVFVANSAYQLQEYDLDGASYIREGHFAVFLAPDVGRLGLMKFAVLLLGRSVRKHRDIEVLHGRKIEISGPGSRLVARDGEREKMTPPFRFVRHEDALRVIAPARPETEA
ncbi:Diacylglycerol kinase family enzyme [Tranquillimonas rosea]|uniref:Diacylglycerol kinase family enzyme n=1 Tax=Tranquillimonas rosea TaxID=641238 RepID=A0A1H9U7X7_9RHOB|nr:diacylglycerol kinase family protein [Tranquillimonas rosea]SES05257.1 Diacylglycerol kinase family enzyme [Tranquillimonas rosea]